MAFNAFLGEIDLIQRLLILALKGALTVDERSAIFHLYRVLGDETVWQAAQANRIETIVAHTLFKVIGERSVSFQWREVHEKVAHRIRSYLEELDRIAALLASQDIRLVALKNGGIARGIYPCAGCCPMGDLDVLVERRHFKDAHRILLAEGYRLEFRSPFIKADSSLSDIIEKEGGLEYRKILPNGEELWFELQWRPVAGQWIRPEQEPRAEELINRSVPIPGSAARLLCPEDNLLQVALHTAKHSFVRPPGLRLHLDVDRIVRFTKVNWDVFVNRVNKLRVMMPVFFSLAIPKELFVTPIPDEVLKALEPPRWKRYCITTQIRHAGLMNCNEKKFNILTYLVFHALLYNGLPDLLRVAFPPTRWMRDHYRVRKSSTLLYYYIRHVTGLVRHKDL